MEADNSINNPVTDFESDKMLVRTLFNNFESLLVFMFYSEANEESKRYITKLTKLIRTYNIEGVKWFSIEAEKCP